MYDDVRGLPLTASSDRTVALFDETIASYLEYRANTVDTLKAVLEQEPDFVMGHCLNGYLMSHFGSHKIDQKVAVELALIEPKATDVTAREAAHITALRAWHEGNMIQATAVWDAILVDYPRDILALRLLHFNSFWLGRNYHIRDSSARVFSAWDQSMPGYSSVLAMLAFGHEECGDYQRAEFFGRKSVELNPDDLWGIHAVAHVLEMQGRLKEGLEWTDYPAAAWDDRNPFKGHLWWHRSLFLLESGAYDQVLDLYDNSIREIGSDFYLDIQNSASLLMRLQALNVDVGQRWDELAEAVAGRIDDHVLAFNEMHSMMALALSQRFDDGERLLSSLASFAATPNNFAAAITKPVVDPLCRAVLAYGRGDYATTVNQILPRRYDISCIGASHAQRDVFTLILIEAAIRGKRLSVARSLLEERITLRPNSYGNWNKYGEVLAAIGDSGGAEAARAQAQTLLAA